MLYTILDNLVEVFKLDTSVQLMMRLRGVSPISVSEFSRTPCNTGMLACILLIAISGDAIQAL